MTKVLQYNPKQWGELAYKDKAAYITALSSFFMGWTLIFISLFLPPVGEIPASVITVFGTALVYSGSIFGIAIYLKNTKGEILTSTLDKVEQMIEDKLSKKQE